MNSFLWPLVEELLTLAAGVPAFDVTDGERGQVFTLHAYPLVGAGDIPAVTILICVKGHNGKRPCRLCLILAVRVPGNHATTHYVPLDRHNHPLLSSDDAILRYDPASLPMRTADSFAEAARATQFASSGAEAERLAKESGVKGISLLSYVPSLTLPTSFPYDFMHLVYENVMKNLILLWSGKYKDLDAGTGSYVIDPSCWKEIGLAAGQSGSTIPGTFGARFPNFVESAQEMTADSWSFWLLYLGPVLLEGRFSRPVYYNHFLLLSEIAATCIQFVLNATEITQIRRKCIQWVQEYEECVIVWPRSVVLDRNAEDQHADVDFFMEPRFGQLKHIFVVNLAPNALLQLPDHKTLILAGILPCKVSRRNARGMPVYKQMGRYGVVDLECLQCLVGRVHDRGEWTIIDRSESIQRTFALADEAD
ncbi:hypothetical protein FISHEDRAFT_42529 [Fistulina hepatica ATCC 64428]|uniref:Uncharacterized protein n=1 Tax=Fistulina hepatica ATCC 64428 TaxID=1128425 RepID=A0A0D7AD99_9AGAR|nr:hypothetical protein FISHEDRAFT_42529 [Fistulina hepatica ATCC 64428]